MRSKTIALPAILLLTLNISSVQPAPGRGETLGRIGEEAYRLVRASDFAMRDDKSEFQIRALTFDRRGQAHARFDQYHRGLRVFNGQLIAHLGRDGRDGEVTGVHYPDIDLDVRPALNNGEAVAVAAVDFRRAVSAEPAAELMILPWQRGYRLVYRVELADLDGDSPAEMVYFVGAEGGEILFKYSNLKTALGGGCHYSGGGPAFGLGRGRYSGAVTLSTAIRPKGGFEMVDLLRGGSCTNGISDQGSHPRILRDADNEWGDFGGSDRNSAGVDVHYGVQTTFDYFRLMHGRVGVAGDGRGVYNRVHYGRRHNSAFWSDICSCIAYGDGDGLSYGPVTSLDIVAHEMTHGLTSHTANLVYHGESGALNEATSDIFAVGVEFYADNAGDAGDYLIGEKVKLQSPRFLRDLSDPRADGRSIDHYSLYTAGMDVHYASGIANNFFYLLAEGGVNRTSGLAVTGIGRDQAAAIWYQALIAYLTPGAGFAAARRACLAAAADLFGDNSPQSVAVAEAWRAVGVE